MKHVQQFERIVAALDRRFEEQAFLPSADNVLAVRLVNVYNRSAGYYERRAHTIAPNELAKTARRWRQIAALHRKLAAL